MQTLAEWLNRKPKGKATKRPLKRCRVKKVSGKLSKALREYTKLRRAYLTRGTCEAALPVCTGRMVEIHHAQGRGPNLNNVNTWVGTCRECHLYIHAHPSEARRLGLLQ